MRIITNPGLSVSAVEAERYRVAMMPQRIMVDGVEYDTRVPISFATIDAWMKRAKSAPHIVGTTAEGGRATFARAFVANALGVSPVIVFQDGEMRPDRRVKRSEVVAEIVERAVKKIGRGTAIWAGVADGGNDRDAQRLARAVRSAFDVQRLTVRPFCATSYLNLGPGSLALTYTPVDALPWTPPRVALS